MRGCVTADAGRRLCQPQCLEPSGRRLGCPGAGAWRGGGRGWMGGRSGVRSTAFFHPYPGQSRKTASSSLDLRAGSPCVWSCCFHSSVNFLAELFPSKPALSGWASVQFLQMKRKQGETGEERRGEDGEGEEQMGGGRKQKRRDGPGPVHTMVGLTYLPPTGLTEKTC